MIAKVLLPVPLSQLFDYRIDTDGIDVAVGQRVLVEFGSQQQVGLVAELIKQPSEDDGAAVKKGVEDGELKPIIAVLDDFPIVNRQWWELIRFASRYYAEPLGKAFRNALPTRLRTNKGIRPRMIELLSLTDSGQRALADDSLPSNASKQRRLLALVHQAGQIRPDELRQQGFVKSDWQRRIDSGWLSLKLLSPYAEHSPIYRPDYQLNSEQQQIIDAIVPHLRHYAAHLLYGVTGSGKTEVYINLIEKIIASGQQVLLLVPEIGLTPQMLSRFTARFGRRVATYHSGLTDSARKDIFLAAQSGDLPILIGTRSAIFVPMNKLGLILVDEEHDLSYKQYEGFLYNARDLAIYRAKQHGINVVLGSATPSLESLYNVKQQRLQLHRLHRRATKTALPKIVMVDRRGESQQQVLSNRVQKKMRQVLQAGQQILLFLNRRGFSPVMMCNDCGWQSDCPSCSVFQTAHIGVRKLCCHHCGHIEPLPLQCPDCQSANLFFAGAGTEKLELQLAEQFPHHRILRLDRDKQTTAKQLNKALDSIYNHEVDIILGTQLVVKGHHFPKVAMVCVVDADSALFSSDFRAEERLYQQLIQVAGRAGRESDTGTVYIQSNAPDHTVFHALIKHDYWSYAQTLLSARIEHGLPPRGAIALVKASALDKSMLIDYLHMVREALRQHTKHLDVLGPVPLAVEKIKKRYQAQLWLSADDKLTLQKQLPRLKQIITHYDKSNRFKTIIDVDAM